MRDKYLPIGTVVLLKNAEKRIMITGFCCINNNKMYDYIGCLYPEGYITKDDVLLFDHKDIDKLYYMGFESEEDKEFKGTLNKVLGEYNKENTGIQNNN